MSELKTFLLEEDYILESGASISGLTIGYHTYGRLNARKDNVVWVCHALTANSDVDEWWGEVAGKNGFFNQDEHFIVCANILGSVYGSTNPLSINPSTGSPWYSEFPLFTMRDIVGAHLILKEHLGIDQIYFALGGSCGGQQVLELAFSLGDKLKNMMIIVANARETAWSIAIHTTQRMAIETDTTWGQPKPKAGSEGLKTARGIGMLGYRTFKAFVDTQTDSEDKTDNFKAESYIRYQGDKLEKRFNAYSYWYLTKALDSHNLGRGRESISHALSQITTNTLLLGIDSDQLIPPGEQKFMSEWIPKSTFKVLSSNYGHDGFLIEQKSIVNELEKFINSQHGI